MSRGCASDASIDAIEQHLRAAAELIAACQASTPAGSNAEVIGRLDQILAKLGAAAEYPVTWVELEKYVEITGDSVDAVQARRRAGKWLDGKQCKIADGRLWIDLRAAQAWVEEWDSGSAMRANLALIRQPKSPSKK
ncbi:hypothetical protein [Massilia sp. DWR3-1-1]|uniref:hypothetical protein n=1 Tax=Massilia sp. DWR3-1-1 TaxID=2804559 RepID=UPI003CF3CBDC